MPRGASHAFAEPPATKALADTSSPQRRRPEPPIALWPDLMPTQFGGLPFLLPVLQRLGLPAWADDAGIDAATCARCRAGRCVAAPARRCRRCGVAARRALGQRIDTRHGSLRLRRGRITRCRRPRAALSQRLPATLAESDAHDRTRRAVAHRRPRRLAAAARVSALHTLVCRRSRAGAEAPRTPTLHIHVNDADLRLRRHGLDIDPGWLPWFGRVVAYHYSTARTSSR